MIEFTQYIASGRNPQNLKVVLWRVGNYKYEIEIAGRVSEKLECAYSQAIKKFNSEIKGI
jgi:hypothetical protein